MLYLILSIACSVFIAHLFKYAEQRAVPIFGLFAVNYLVATGVAVWGSGGFAFVAELNPPVIGLGVLLGALFIWTFFLMMFTIQKLGISIPVSLMRLSAVLPTLGSIVIFGEIPGWLQLVGICLAFASLPLASKERLTLSKWKEAFHSGFGWAVVLFFSFGVADFLFKVQTELLPLDNSYNLMFLIFGTAFIIGLSIAMYQRIRLTRQIVALGVLLGVVNLFSTYFFVLALRELPGIFVYPSNGIGIIMFSAITSVLIWKEKLHPRNIVFLVIAAVALVLIY